MPKAYLDTCCFIDLVAHGAGVNTGEQTEEDIWFTNRLLLASRNKDVQVYTSLLTLAECTHIRDEHGIRIVTDDVKDHIEALLSPESGVIPIEPSIFVIDKARELAWQHRIFLKGVDALHVASAVLTGCQEFLTGDKYIKAEERKVLAEKLSLRLCSPRETTLLPDHYRQDALFNDEAG